MREVSFYRYQLLPMAQMGSRATAGPRNGSLIRFTFDEGRIGYGDCFPWPELGDLPLEQQLELLKQSKMTPLLERTVEFAQLDALARHEKKSLFEELKIPPSHALRTHVSLLSRDDLMSLAREGYGWVKLKMGTDLNAEVKQIQELGPLLRGLGFKLRLDFNSSFDLYSFEIFLQNLGPWLECIDFIEDPIPYDPKSWTRLQRDWNIRLALDRLDPNHWPDLDSGSFSVWVHKPAVQVTAEVIQRVKERGVSIVVTSYLDHPLGQITAAWVAAKINQNEPGLLEPCGLTSHLAYQSHSFSQELRVDQARLIPPLGTGFGFDRLLEKLPWR